MLHTGRIPSSRCDGRRARLQLPRRVIGVLGWLDVPLQPFAYPVLPALLLITACAAAEMNEMARLRLTVSHAMAALGYCLAVFLVFYLVWSPLDADNVEGVQG